MRNGSRRKEPKGYGSVQGVKEDVDLDRILRLYEIIKRYELLVEFLLENSVIFDLDIPELEESVRRVERATIVRALKRTRWNKVAAAKILKIGNKTVYTKIINYKITRDECE